MQKLRWALGIIKSDRNRDVRDGGLFMFLNQRLNRKKILYWNTDRKHVIITHAELQGIFSGGDLASVRKQLRAAMAIEPKLFQLRFEWLPVFLIG